MIFRMSLLLSCEAIPQLLEHPIDPDDLLDDLLHRLGGSRRIGLDKQLCALGLPADRRHRLSQLEDDRRPEVSGRCPRHATTICAR
jgi:hypothetical protein